jgi:serine/threonine-protein kinase
LTGERPFNAGSDVDIALAQVRQPPPPLPDWVAPPLADLVMRLLAKDPALRPASGAELAHLLRGLDLTDSELAGPDTFPVDAVHVAPIAPDPAMALAPTAPQPASATPTAPAAVPTPAPVPKPAVRAPAALKAAGLDPVPLPAPPAPPLTPVPVRPAFAAGLLRTVPGVPAQKAQVRPAPPRPAAPRPTGPTVPASATLSPGLALSQDPVLTLASPVAVPSAGPAAPAPPAVPAPPAGLPPQPVVRPHRPPVPPASAANAQAKRNATAQKRRGWRRAAPLAVLLLCVAAIIVGIVLASTAHALARSETGFERVTHAPPGSAQTVEREIIGYSPALSPYPRRHGLTKG